jgi:radical SAM superfamily enzyme YgiQ (UPF0313 family)
MQSAVPELIAGLCPKDSEVEIFNEKECEIPLDRHWDVVFFSYLHASYEHTKVLSAIFRSRGMATVAGGRHASYFYQDCTKYFDSVIVGEPEPNVSTLIRDFETGQLKPLYQNKMPDLQSIGAYRYDLLDLNSNRFRLPAIEASRGCPFSCNFCVLTGWERYRYRPVESVVKEIELKMTWNKNLFGLLDNAFMFVDNNLGGSPKYLRELCHALIPLKKTWGCALTFNIIKDEELLKLMAKAGCRYVYTGLESLNPESLYSMNKGQNNIKEVDRVIRLCFSSGILLSFGLLVGSDGDTNEYLENIPVYLSDLKYFSVTFLGIVCPYPETEFYKTLARENRILPGSSIRDYDGYTLCHQPQKLQPAELVEHFCNLCCSLAHFSNIAKHYWTKLGMSDASRYKSTILLSGPEILSIKNPIKNQNRKYIAGFDSIELWDQEKMLEFGLPSQRIS